MSWKDYETLDATKEIVTEKEMEELSQKYDLPKMEEDKNPFGRVNKRGRAEIFKKRNS